MGCATLFVLAGIILPLLYVVGGTYEGGEDTFVPAFVGVPAFLIGHVLAILALFSKVPASRRSGKRALILMWGSICLAVAIGFISDALRHSSLHTAPR